MRILRLTNSNDFWGDIAPDARGRRFVADAMERETGEPVETMVKAIWPSDDLPDIVQRWVEQFQPDIVFLKTTNFWFAHESVPLKLRRRFGRIGKTTGDAGFKAARKPWLAHNRVFRKFRYFAQATIGGETHFTIDYTMQNMEAVIRRVLRNEDILLVVRGSRGGRERPEIPAKLRERAYARRAEFKERMAALCASLDVPFITSNTFRKYEPETRAADMFHSNELGHAQVGTFEAEALVAVWKEHVARGTRKAV